MPAVKGGSDKAARKRRKIVQDEIHIGMVRNKHLNEEADAALLPGTQVSTTEEGAFAKALQPPSAAIPILNKAMMQIKTEDGWIGSGAVGQRLANIASDFDPRTYRYRKLSDLVRKTGAFDIDQPEGRAMRIRAKPKPPSKTWAKTTPAR
jgi:hypothetical protein